MKCGLYQIRLTGTMIINTALLHTVHHKYTKQRYRNPQPSYSATGGSSWTAASENGWDSDYNWNLTTGTMYASGQVKQSDSTPFREIPRICSVQLSDFNRSFGATGEFDNLLRVETACSNTLVNRMLNASMLFGSENWLPPLLTDYNSNSRLSWFSIIGLTLSVSGYF